MKSALRSKRISEAREVLTQGGLEEDAHLSLLVEVQALTLSARFGMRLQLLPVIYF